MEAHGLLHRHNVMQAFVKRGTEQRLQPTAQRLHVVTFDESVIRLCGWQHLDKREVVLGAGLLEKVNISECTILFCVCQE